jgi:hypothetical protein
MTVPQFRAMFPMFSQVPDTEMRRTIRAAGRELLAKHFPTPALRKAMAPHRNALLGNLVAHKLTVRVGFRRGGWSEAAIPVLEPPPLLHSTFGQQYMYLRRLAEGAKGR